MENTLHHTDKLTEEQFKDRIRLALAMTIIKVKPPNVLMKDFLFDFRACIRGKRSNTDVENDPFAPVGEMEDMRKMMDIMKYEIGRLKEDIKWREVMGGTDEKTEKQDSELKEDTEGERKAKKRKTV